MKIEDTILRQYGNSPKLKSIIYSFNNGMKITGIIDDIYNKIINLDTANSLGLDFWGKIVQVSRYVKFDTVGNVFGFDGSGAETFNNGTFYNGVNSTTTLKLSNDFYRSLIKIKAAANISDTTISSLNYLISSIYPENGKAFVTDNQDMTMDYNFPFYLDSSQIGLLKNSNVIPRPSGVKLRAIIMVPSETFGFDGSNCETFNNGTFFDIQGYIDVN